jgi:hypothetical protein
LVGSVLVVVLQDYFPKLSPEDTDNLMEIKQALVFWKKGAS